MKHASAKEFIVLMAVLMSIVAISIDAMLPALGLLHQQFTITHPNQVQLVIMLIFAGEAIGQLIAGPMSDALGRKPVLYATLFIYLIGSFMCYQAESFTQLLVGRFIQGIGVAGPYITAVSVVRDKFSGNQMAQVMSIIMMIFILIPAVAPSIGQAIINLGHWRAIFLLYMVYSFLVGLWIMLRLEETLAPEKRLPMRAAAFIHGFSTVIHNRTTMSYMLCMGLCFGSFIGYLGASQQIFQEQFGVGEAFSLYFGALALVLGFASLVNARIVEKLGMRRVCRYAMGAIVLSSLLFLLLHLVLPITLPIFCAYATVFFFCFGLMFGNLNAITMEPMGEIAGMASAITGAASSVLALALGTFIGQLYDHTLVPIAFGFLLCGGVSCLLMHGENRHHLRRTAA